MRKLLVVFFLCAPSMLFAHLEEQEAVLLQWFNTHPEEKGEEAIKVQIEAKGVVSNHRFDNVNWSTNVLQGLHFGIGGGPIIAGMVTVIAGVITVGVWPAAVFAAAGIAHGAEKIAQKTDVRTQKEEFLTFNSQRNYQRYLASRLLVLIAGFRASPSPNWMTEQDRITSLFAEWAAITGTVLPNIEQDTDVTVAADTLALRINTEIHKYKPVQGKWQR